MMLNKMIYGSTQSMITIIIDKHIEIYINIYKPQYQWNK